nr:hypothetical protein [Leptolyngbya sp. FACHB-671]
MPKRLITGWNGSLKQLRDAIAINFVSFLDALLVMRKFHCPQIGKMGNAQNVE